MTGLGPKGQTAHYQVYDRVAHLSEIDFTVSDGTSEEIQRSDLFTVCQAALSYAQHLKDTAGQSPYPDSDAYKLIQAEKIRLAVQRIREERA